MKVLLAGNLVNLGYTVARELRKVGIESELIMEKNPHRISDPKTFDPNLLSKYPNWIKFIDRNKSGWKRGIIKTMRDRKYDLIHAYTEYPIFAYVSRRRFIANPTGSDIRDLAFGNYSITRRILLRRAYNRAKVVIASSPEVIELLSRLKVKQAIFLPVLMDLSFFKPNEHSSKPDKFTILHPVNLDWKVKGNDKIIRGFAKFVKDFPQSLLIIIDRGIDSQRTHELVKKLDLENNVQFVQGPLNYHELLNYYQKSDVITEQFLVGEFGGIGRESLCVGKPLLGFFHVSKYEKIFGKAPPVINAQSPDEICKELHILSDTKVSKKIGEEGREWAKRYHSAEVYIPKIKIIYDSVLNGENPLNINKKISEF